MANSMETNMKGHDQWLSQGLDEAWGDDEDAPADDQDTQRKAREDHLQEIAGDGG